MWRGLVAQDALQSTAGFMAASPPDHACAPTLLLDRTPSLAAKYAHNPRRGVARRRALQYIA